MSPYFRSPGLALEQCRLLLQFASANGLSLEECLSETEINPDQLEGPHFEPSPEQELAIISNICAKLTNSAERLGYEIGLKIKPHSFGVIGQAMLTSATLKDALDIAIRYCQAAFHFTQCRTTVNETTTTLHWQAPTNTRPDLANFLLARDIGACASIIRFASSDDQAAQFELLGLPFIDANLCNEIAKALNVSWTTSNNNAFLRANTESLLVEMPQKNMQSSLVLEEMCHAQLTTKQQDKPSLLEQVASLLKDNRYILSREQAAKSLCISSRTLARQFLSENTTWRAFVAQQRIQEAQNLLKNTNTTIELISEMVGFSSSSAFSLAFRRSCGVSPRNYRKSHARENTRDEIPHSARN